METSFVNEPGSVVGLTLRPGADPGRVAREAQRALSDEAVERGTPPPRGQEAAPLGGRSAAAELQSERWHDRDEVTRQAAEILAAEAQASGGRFPWLLLILLLLGAAAGLEFLRRRRRAAAG